MGSYLLDTFIRVATNDYGSESRLDNIRDLLFWNKMFSKMWNGCKSFFYLHSVSLSCVTSMVSEMLWKLFVFQIVYLLLQAKNLLSC